MPPIDSQGSIGSCSSQSVTYTQFTIAVSQYMNNVLGNTSWNPSSGNKAYIFSPKSTFVYSGAGTKLNYDILVDSGALPLTMSTFKKSGEASINNDPLSRAWDCAKNYMATALKYRLSGYEEVEFDAFSYDFTTTMGQAHLERVKRAVYEGNAVSICGWSSYWQYTKVMEPGTLAKVGDGIIWAGWKTEDQTSDGNHAVAIVGYDDNVSVTVAGVKMTGAFLVANSWGVSYQNDGYVWMTYDAFNKVSGYPALAEEGFYSNRPAFVSTEDSVAKIKINYNQRENTQLLYTKTAEKKTIEGKEYSVYTIQDTVYNKYLGVNNVNTLVWNKDANDSCTWVIIPFEDYSKWSGFEFTADGKFEETSYKGTYLVCSAANYKNMLSPSFIKIGGQQGTVMGREVKLEAVTGKKIAEFACFVPKYSEKSETYTCGLRAATVPTLREFERTGTLYRTSFVYWDKDVKINEPNLIVEVEVDAVKRESLSVTLYRSDLGGNAITKLPQIIDDNLQSTTAMADPSGETRFDGKPADGTFAKAYLAFGFNDLAQLSETYDYSNLLWGVKIKGNNLGVKVRGLRLLTLDGKVLSEVKVNDEYAHIGKGEERLFYFDLGGELKSYAASPGKDTFLFNVGAQLHLKKKSQSLVLSDAPDKDMKLTFEKNEDGTYTVWNEGNWLLDIKGKEIKEGVVVKRNVQSDERKTQKWIVEMIEGNAFVLKLAADPTYFAAYNPTTKQVELTTKKDSTGYYKWQAYSDLVIPRDIEASVSGGKITLKGVVPEGYTSGDITIKVTNADGTYNGAAVSVTPKEGVFETTLNEKLPAGTYIFTAIYNGAPYGFQYIYTIK
ncbi:MAG: hypothetical protein E7675_07190 [Ruminococcaceae bacterium]|nr:hypothetical protein [Oscillospiraceae bacterium]